MTADTELLSTGIPSLDRLLAGGIPSRQVLLIAGYPGSGKTLLASQIAFAQAARGSAVLLATASSEPHTKILESLQGFSFFKRERVGREIFLLSAYPWLRKGMRETREMLLSSVREQKARLLVLDGLRSLRDVWHDEAGIREFLAELGVGMATHDCTGVFTLEVAPDRVLDSSEAGTVDGVLTLGLEAFGMGRLRRAEVVKLRGRQHPEGRHALRLDPRGFTVFPRLETLPALEWTAGSGRAAFGVGPLDRWLGGGVPEGGLTLLTGSVGAGKTLLALAFARAGLEQGAPVDLHSLREPVASLLQRAGSVGVPLVPGETLQLHEAHPEEGPPDAIIGELLEKAAGAKRLVLLDADALEPWVEPSRKEIFFGALARQLRGTGRETLITCASESAAAQVLSREADNVLSVALAEEGRLLRRELRVVKLRAAATPRSPWPFQISEKGFQAG